jgi:hypothetical protein
MYFKNEFTDYLISIAPSEETVLFVKQIPKADLFHKDGAQQCAWPAYLPSKYDSKGAWYCNTASFIIKRFKTASRVLPRLTVK